MSKLKLKCGDKAIVVQDTSMHLLPLDTIVIIDEVGITDGINYCETCCGNTIKLQDLNYVIELNNKSLVCESI